MDTLFCLFKERIQIDFNFIAIGYWYCFWSVMKAVISWPIRQIRIDMNKLYMLSELSIYKEKGYEEIDFKYQRNVNHHGFLFTNEITY